MNDLYPGIGSCEHVILGCRRCTADRDRLRATVERIASAMNCIPDDGDDLVEAVRLLVHERDEARATVRLLSAERDAYRSMLCDLMADGELEASSHYHRVRDLLKHGSTPPRSNK